MKTLTTNKELWTFIEEYEGYMVSNHGRVISFRYSGASLLKLFKPTSKCKYVVVKFFKDGKRHSHYLQDVVAQLFLNNKNNFKFVRHKDGDILNNKVSNLEWVQEEDFSDSNR